MNFNADRKTWILLGALAALAFGYFALVFLPARKALAQMREDIRLKQEHVTGAASLPAIVATVGQELAESRQYVGAVQESSPRTARLSALFGKLYELARRAGVTPVRFEPQPAQPFETLDRVSISFGLTGSYPQLHEFLRSLEELPMPLWVDAIEIKQAGEAAGSATAELTLVVFADNREISD
jgi:Tfp pilus assembly protein PilO